MMKILNTHNYLYAISLLHNNPKVCVKKTFQGSNENISEKWVLIEDTEPGRRGRFPRSESAQWDFIFKQQLMLSWESKKSQKGKRCEQIGYG